MDQVKVATGKVTIIIMILLLGDQRFKAIHPIAVRKKKERNKERRPCAKEIWLW